MSRLPQVMIIDDEPRMCDSLKTLLISDNYSIVTAGSGHGALALMAEDRFDLILMDYVLPDISGRQLMHKIRELDSEAVLIVMTGMPSVDKAVEALREGAHDFLRKPFNYDELKNKIRQMLRSKTADGDSHIVPGQSIAAGLAATHPVDARGSKGDDGQVEAPTLLDLAQEAYEVSPAMPISRIKEIMNADIPIYSVVAVANGKPVGLLMSIHLDRLLSHRYGFALYWNKPVEYIMDAHPLVLDGGTTLEEAVHLAMSRNIERLYDHLVVTRGGALAGTVSVRRILKALNELERKRATTLDKAYKKLQLALDRVKTLSGLLPICSHCKKIRDDQGYWNQIEAYIARYSDVDFSHSICPDCMKKYYPDISLD